MPLCLVVCLPLLVSTSEAQELTPEIIREQFPEITRVTCNDHESGEMGICHGFSAPDGTFYMVFVQGHEPVFMRRVLPGQPYETIWRVNNDTAL